MTAKNRTLLVQDIEITVSTVNDEDYISLTDMLKAKDGDFFIADWLRNRNTLEFIGIWEELNNPSFNYGEFATIKSQAGLNSYKVSVKDLIEKANIIGLQAKAGRYGGTYAHRDIAFEFGLWISPTFKLYLIKEFQRLKDLESKSTSIEWQVKRELAKVNYRIQTDAIQAHLLPNYDQKQHGFIYASEADMLNEIVFGKTAHDWKKENPNAQGNQRDYGTALENALIANLEAHNALLVKQEIPMRMRAKALFEISKQFRASMEKSPTMKKLNEQTKPPMIQSDDS